MSDQYVTVATFNKSFEANLAKNLLENEGIPSILSGDLAGDVLLGTISEDQIALQVHEGDAQRATGILAAAVEKDWEDQAEAGVWTCSICGEPISEALSICHCCQTPRDAIRATPRPGTDIRAESTARRPSEAGAPPPPAPEDD